MWSSEMISRGCAQTMARPIWPSCGTWRSTCSAKRHHRSASKTAESVPPGIQTTSPNSFARQLNVHSIPLGAEPPALSANHDEDRYYMYEIWENKQRHRRQFV